MIRVRFEEPSSKEWLAWRKRATEATDALIVHCGAGGRPEIRATLYKEMRSILFDAFYGKCAYCEVEFRLDQDGDIEHFRPKAGVLDEHDQRVEHPGYYWLAYDWRNLLPSCSLCNRVRRKKDGRLVGKGERFPVKGQRATAPGEEADEEPMFLHPVHDDPEPHFRLDPETGVLAGLTPKGWLCVELLDLNREGMPEARRRVYASVQSHWGMVSIAMHARDRKTASEHLDYLNDFHRGKAQFSSAGRKAIKDAEAEMRPLLEQQLRLFDES
jgi:uncharacterized protein (TIGR02646 family)